MYIGSFQHDNMNHIFLVPAWRRIQFFAVGVFYRKYCKNRGNVEEMQSCSAGRRKECLLVASLVSAYASIFYLQFL